MNVEIEFAGALYQLNYGRMLMKNFWNAIAVYTGIQSEEGLYRKAMKWKLHKVRQMLDSVNEEKKQLRAV